MNDMNLACFMSVVRTRNFSVSAKGLMVSQQFVSQNIKKLEDELGFPLLSRKSHTVELTQAGERFYRWCTDYSAALFQAGLPERSSADPTHRLAIGWSDWGGCAAQIQNIIRSFADEHPEMMLSCYQGGVSDTRAMAENGLLDLAFLPLDSVQGSPLTAATLYRQPLQLILASDNLLANDSVPLSELLTLPCCRVALGEQEGQEPIEIAELRRQNLPLPRQILTQDSMDVLYSVVMDGHVCAITVPDESADSSPFVYRRVLPGTAVPMAAVYHAENASALCRALCARLFYGGEQV